MLHLSLVKAQICDHISVGAQNCSATGEGAYTGEVPCDHLADIEMKYVMIGQNERRLLNNETQEVVNQKLQQAFDCSLEIIYCIGENSDEREAERTQEVLAEQLAHLKGMEVDWSQLILVYEPLWAMGSGNQVIASADQTQESCEIVRAWIKENVSEEAAAKVRIVYGGSVTETNAENFIKLPDVDGFLVGTISTKPIFRTIFEMVINQTKNENWEK